MNKSSIFVASLLFSLILSVCTSPATTQTPAVPSTETDAPTETSIPEPSLTPTPAILDLEILEWYEHDNPNKANAEDTDTTVEILIHNPNDFHVRVIDEEVELRFLNAAGEVVYTNPNPSFYIWKGDWMTPNQTAAVSACVCFWNSGLETKEWKTFELVAPLEIIIPPAYTTDVEYTAEFVLLEEVLHGYEGPGVATTLANNSDQVLEGISTLTFAYDSSGRYVGMASYGTAVVDFRQGENIGIQPGATASGFQESEVNYLGNERLTYEVQAIGIVAVGAPTLEPLGEPAAEWQGIPIMPGAISGGETSVGYEFTTPATVDEIMQFYEAALAELGYPLINSGQQAGVTFLFFEMSSMQAIVGILPEGDISRVQISVTQ